MRNVVLVPVVISSLLLACGQTNSRPANTNPVGQQTSNAVEVTQSPVATPATTSSPASRATPAPVPEVTASPEPAMTVQPLPTDSRPPVIVVTETPRPVVTRQPEPVNTPRHPEPMPTTNAPVPPRFLPTHAPAPVATPVTPTPEPAPVGPEFVYTLNFVSNSCSRNARNGDNVTIKYQYLPHDKSQIKYQTFISYVNDSAEKCEYSSFAQTERVILTGNPDWVNFNIVMTDEAPANAGRKCEAKETLNSVINYRILGHNSGYSELIMHYNYLKEAEQNGEVTFNHGGCHYSYSLQKKPL